MKTIKGEYVDGQVKLLEKVPSEKRNKVLITFLDEEENEEEILRSFSLQQTCGSFQEYLKDEREDLYQEFLKTGK